jgi:predicted dehydrogenase
VLAAIEGKEKQIVTQEQIINNMKVLMAAFESAKTGTTVAVN